MNSQNSSPSTIAHQDIAERAHTIWEREGCPAGRELDHWLQAEQELQSECSDQENMADFQQASRRRAAGSSASGRIAKSGQLGPPHARLQA